ncbi:hypothetical protein G7054_g13323 [Neopestalotiopsis clavispora]|nr:hypothetical protein G7054_g13323 [Neopestalotiopsis clavispora]
MSDRVEAPAEDHDNGGSDSASAAASGENASAATANNAVSAELSVESGGGVTLKTTPGSGTTETDKAEAD